MPFKGFASLGAIAALIYVSAYILVLVVNSVAFGPDHYISVSDQIIESFVGSIVIIMLFAFISGIRQSKHTPK